MPDRVALDGKFFSVSGDRFDFHGVTYGTFRPRAVDGERFPDRDRIKRDFSAMRESGFTVVRTYTLPPDDLLDVAADWGLRVLAGVNYPDWRYLVGVSRRERSRVAREARRTVREAACRFAGDERILALSLGNEVPADVLRWFGTRPVARAIDELVSVVRDEDPQLLVTYANYPTAEYLPLDNLDFLTFNVFLEHQPDFRRYLTRLHHLAGDRPLVLGELGLHVEDSLEGEARQAEAIRWQLETALERGVAGTCAFTWTDEWWVGDAAVEGWHFGLTREDRSPRPALAVAAEANGRTVRDLRADWPSMSVVICAYNSASTLDECLRHSCSLAYPDLEILVVDDGSTDETAAIAGRHPRARLVEIEHAGLSAARNEGYRVANGDIVAYLDSDAYPTPEWPYYLALAFDGSAVVGAGGPNVPPADDPISAQAVARSPGGPVHVLLSDDRAEHVPGCNMAFWRDTLVEVGGFDPVYLSAGDDVSLCWKILDGGGEIGFHPAALVWHRRRAGLRRYLRQQRGYGRSEALIEARHPDKFTRAGTARWRGHIYDSFAPAGSVQRIYRGEYGAAAYQSVYRGGGYALDLAHQIGVPPAVVLAATAPLALVQLMLGLPALLAALFMLGLAFLDGAGARPPRSLRWKLPFRARVAVMHLLQPLVRLWGRTSNRTSARRDLPPLPALPPVTCRRGGTLILPSDRPRAELAADVLLRLRHGGWRVLQPSGWEEYDGRLLASCLLHADVVTSAHPEGAVQLRIRRRLRWRPVLAASVCVGTLSFVSALAALLLIALLLGEVGRGEKCARRALRMLSTSERR